MTRLYVLACYVVFIGLMSENLAAYVAWILFTLFGGPRENWPGGAW